MIAPGDDEALTAWRCWFARPDEGLLRPIYKRGLAWKPREVLEAICPEEVHEVPADDCMCGVWAASKPGHLHEVTWTFDPPEGVSPLPGILVVGQVSMWGRVIEYDHGWRASHAYPKHLYAVTEDAALAARLRDTYLVPVEYGDKARQLGKLLPAPLPAKTTDAEPTMRGWSHRLARRPRAPWTKVHTEAYDTVPIPPEWIGYDAREHRDAAGDPQLLPAPSLTDGIAWSRRVGRLVVMVIVYDPRDEDNVTQRLWCDVVVLRRKRGNEYLQFQELMNPRDPFRAAEAKVEKLRAGVLCA